MTKVDHEIGVNGWVTKCEGQMRMRSDKIDETKLDVRIPKTIVVSTSEFDDFMELNNLWNIIQNVILLLFPNMAGMYKR